jgi:hypothetical protein
VKNVRNLSRYFCTFRVARATDLIGRGGNNEKDCTPIEMVKIVSNAFKIKDKLLNNKYFESYAMSVEVEWISFD